MGIRLRALKTFLFGKPPTKEESSIVNYAPSMSGYSPIWSDFGSSIYNSDIIVQAIRCKANEFKKLKPRHIRITNGQQSVIIDSSIAKLLKRPNDIMTISDFLEKIAILLELNKNVFIYPSYYLTNDEKKVYTGLYPLKPSNVEYVQDASGSLFIKMTFGNGDRYILPAKDVIHWRKDFGVDDYFGGNLGNSDNSSLLKMLKEYDKITQSIATALNVSTKINGIVKINTMLRQEDIEKAQNEFNEKLTQNESGIVFTDNKTEYTNIPRNVQIVNADTMKYFYEAILRNTGVSLAILNGDYTAAQKQAFYEHALEADIISLGQAMSKVIFNEREEAFGNEIILYTNKAEFMTIEQAVAYMNVAVPAGALSVNQILAFGGFPPIEGGDVRPQGYNNLIDENNNNTINDKKPKEPQEEEPNEEEGSEDDETKGN